MDRSIKLSKPPSLHRSAIQTQTQNSKKQKTTQNAWPKPKQTADRPNTTGNPKKT